MPQDLCGINSTSPSRPAVSKPSMANASSGDKNNGSEPGPAAAGKRLKPPVCPSGSIRPAPSPDNPLCRRGSTQSLGTPEESTPRRTWREPGQIPSSRYRACRPTRSSGEDAWSTPHNASPPEWCRGNGVRVHRPESRSESTWRPTRSGAYTSPGSRSLRSCAGQNSLKR